MVVARLAPGNPHAVDVASRSVAKLPLPELSFGNAFVDMVAADAFDWLVLDWLVLSTLPPQFVVLPGTEGMGRLQIQRLCDAFRGLSHRSRPIARRVRRHRRSDAAAPLLILIARARSRRRRQDIGSFS